jgi:ectoine hydroxylase-related dioxygenase (phytanoyl-CoA dioxygenase family)
MVSRGGFRYIRIFKVTLTMFLSTKQKQFFADQGYLVVENAVTDVQLDALREQFAVWVQQSRSQQVPYGETIDHRPRFDIEPGHSAERPALRRVNAPTDISQAYYDVMRNSAMTDCVAELIGPNVRFHHSKINSKLPGAATEVKWHQDFPFTPHSNDDLVTALLMVDEVTGENGPLQVLPGSHRGEIYDLWHDGIFTGSVADSVARNCIDQAVTCTGKAGSVCLMHTRLLHGSSPNLSIRPRTLFIAVYSAEDAIPCSPNPVPSIYQGELVRGERTDRIRSCEFDIPLPQLPRTASFFDQQARSRS